MSALLLWLPIAMADTPAFDHAYADLDAFLQDAVSVEGVDYATLATRRPRLDAALKAIAGADVSGFDKDQRLALYVNAYNGYTLALVLDNLPLASIRDLDGGNPWKVRTFVVGGETLTLDQIEHGKVRPLGDGRVHAVVNCASVGCPPLPTDPIVPKDLDAQLDAAARRWVKTNAWVVDGSVLRLSRIFEWYAEDFTSWAPMGPGPGTAAQRAALGFLGAFGQTSLPAFERIDWNVYDWSLNDAGKPSAR